MVQQAEGTVEREIAIDRDFDRDDALTSRQARRQLARALTASAHAAHACIDTWLTDFRDDLPMIDVPVLLIHGDADRTTSPGLTPTW
jgi:pimeloyl-ACP methyl ester carboxylesterase